MLEPVTQVGSLEASGAHTRRAGTQAATQELPDLLLIERARSGEERAIEALTGSGNRIVLIQNDRERVSERSLLRWSAEVGSLHARRHVDQELLHGRRALLAQVGRVCAGRADELLRHGGGDRRVLK